MLHCQSRERGPMPPRDLPFCKPPVGYRVWLHAQSVRHRLIPAKHVDNVLFHEQRYHRLWALMQALSVTACSWEIQQNTGKLAGMDSTDKNGGPNYLRAWRLKRGMTQEQLAKEVGTATNMIQYLESGERGLSAKWLRRLAPALKTTSGMLLETDPDEVDLEIHDIWAFKMDAEQRRQLHAIAEALTKTGTGD